MKLCLWQSFLALFCRIPWAPSNVWLWVSATVIFCCWVKPFSWWLVWALNCKYNRILLGIISLIFIIFQSYLVLPWVTWLSSFLVLALQAMSGVGAILASDCCGKTLPIEENGTSELVVLCAVRRMSKLGSITLFVTTVSALSLTFLTCLSTCPDCLKQWTLMWKWKRNTTFPPQVAFSHTVFITAIEALTKTATVVSHKVLYSLGLLQ